MQLVKKLLAHAKQYPFVWLLSIVCSVIFFTNIFANTYILGWDNFSVSLNLPLNFERSFTTWREYRGFGVSSDSEYVDLFRIVVLQLLNTFLPSTAVENFYTVILFIAGIISTYFLLQKVFVYLNLFKDKSVLSSVSFLGALYYGFNMHALETFYFPMAMYTARFAYFPLFFYVFFTLITEKITWKKVILFIVVSLLISTSYLTATIFITLGLLVVGLSALFLKRINKFIAVGIFFGLLNLFWLLPFANYTIQKSALIPEASSFTSVNEALLNKPDKNFSFSRIFTFYPETLNSDALPFRDLKTGEQTVIHSISNPNQLQIMLLTIPVIFVFAGFLYTVSLVRKKQNYQLLAFCILFLFTILFLRRYLPPFGWLYSLLTAYIPLFAIIFRFSGTKFYPLLLIGQVFLFAMGVNVGYILLKKLQNRVQIKHLKTIFITLLVVTLLLPFTAIFSGNLISSLIKNKLPEAYSNIAVYLDAQDPTARVVYLPFDQFSYWRSNSWGYMGSSFLNFMVQQPIMDRTFEPASPQLDHFNMTELRIITSDLPLERKTQLLAGLFQRSGVQYLLFDSTVGEEITARNLKAWGVFNAEKTEVVIKSMEANKLIQPVKTEYIGMRPIILYKVENIQPMFSSSEKVLNVDPKLENTFINPLLTASDTYIQSTDYPMRTYPFWQPDKAINFTESMISIEQEFPHDSTVVVRHPQGIEEVSNVFVQKNNENLELVFVPQEIPLLETAVMTQSIARFPLEDFNIDGDTTSHNYINNWHSIPLASVGVYRVLIDDTLLPLPDLRTVFTEPVYIGSVIIRDQAKLQVFKYEAEDILAGSTLALTKNPNCFEDKKENYTYSMENEGTSSKIETFAGMSCLTTSFNVRSSEQVERLFEVDIDYTAGSQQTAEAFSIQTGNKLQKALVDDLTQESAYVPITACLLDPLTAECLNTHQLLKTPQQTEVTLQSSRTSTYPGLQLLLSIHSTEEKTTQAEFASVTFRSFTLMAEDTITLPVSERTTHTATVDQGDTLTLTVPYIQATDTFLHQPLLNSLQTYDGTCIEQGGYRSVVSPISMPLLSYVQNCYQGIYAQQTYNPNRMYLWLVDYTLQAGRQPSFRLQGNSEYLNEYLSRYQEYPNFAGFHQLQKGNSLFEISYAKRLAKILEGAPFYRAHTTVMPGIAGDSSQLVYEVNQYSEGFSALGIRGMNMISLPSQWADLSVDSDNPELSFGELEIMSYKRIWPSIWQVTVENPTKQDGLLIFGQAYDSQWRLFKTNSVLAAFFGLNKVPAAHVQANGWSNGWIVPAAEWNGESVTFTVFYTPERLLVLGFLVSIVTGVVGSWVLITWQKKEDRAQLSSLQRIFLPVRKFLIGQWQRYKK